MTISMAALDAFISAEPDGVLVEISRALGSTPRECGAFMLVGETSLLGTIGGGQLEFLAIDAARRMKRKGECSQNLDVPLGPEIGQCCGGRVRVSLCAIDEKLAGNIRQRLETQISSYRHVYVMGAGHVGRALALALSPLPLRTIVVDTRNDVLAGLPENVEPRLSALPEAEVRLAPKSSAFVILTHDHALDFLITREALNRGDASYVGMIGSKSKRATFASWLKNETGSNSIMRMLKCPIGDHNVDDKRPEVIAALVVAEILVQTALPRKDDLMIEASVDQFVEQA